MIRSHAAALALLAAFVVSGDLHAGECRLESAEHRVTVLELYTSEGCNSCPPADRWLSGLRRQGVAPESVVLLAFHVDYWDDLGWSDPFSKAAFSARQRTAATRARSGIVYTPQVLLDGTDYRQRDPGRLRAHLAGVNAQLPKAKIRAQVQRSGGEVRVSGEVEASDAPPARHLQAWIATYENGLGTHVRAGENAGKRLNHDYVVRDLVGPFALDETGRVRLDQRLTVPSGSSVQRMGLAIFVEQTQTGSVLQAASLFPLCS